MKLSYKITILLIGILLLLIILKPSYKRFSEFAGGLDTEANKVVTRKTQDYVIFAVFEKQIHRRKKRGDVGYNHRFEDYVLASTERYNGFLLNFYRID